MTAGSPSGPGNIHIVTLDAADAERYIQAALTSPDYERFREQLHREKAQVFTPQENEASTLRVESEQERRVAVHVPIIGGAGSSFYAAFLNADSAAALSSSSGLFEQVTGTDISVVAERDGTVVLDAVMTREGDFVSGTAVAADGETIDLTGLAAHQLGSRVARADHWGCINRCLANAGIANWLIGAIGITCAVACASTLGTGCIICIAVAAGALSGEATACMTSCF
jgi:hypothetical protein